MNPTVLYSTGGALDVGKGYCAGFSRRCIQAVL